MGDKFKRLVKRVLGDDDLRRMRELRRTGADFVKQREVGVEKLYLGHTDSSMSGRYTKQHATPLHLAGGLFFAGVG